MLHVAWSEGQICIGLAGRLDGAGAVVLDQVMKAAGERSCSLAMDLTGVTYLSSAGIRSLLVQEKALRKHGARLVLAGLQPQVRQAMEMSGLLAQFAVKATVDEAVVQVRGSAVDAQDDAGLTPMYFGGNVGKVQRLGSWTTRAELWGRCATRDLDGAASLMPVSLSELPLAFGWGGFGSSREEAAEATGRFMAIGNTVVLSPTGADGYPDFLQGAQPEALSFYVDQAIALPGDPVAVVQVDTAGTTLGEVIAGLRGRVRGGLGFLLAGAREGEEGDWLVCGLLGFENQVFLKRLDPEPVYALRLAGRLPVADVDHPSALAEGFLEGSRLAGVEIIALDQRLGPWKAWVYDVEALVPADEHRLAIEIDGEGVLPDDWELLARRLYADARRLVLKPLTGGYSATTMRAESFDVDGRQMIPTVLKISSRANTDAEAEAYHRYVRTFILNNSTVIMGHAVQGAWAALRYNFVGVNGAGRSLVWLGECYARQPVEETLPLFDEVFERVLRPWYGQTRREVLKPYAAHEPAPRLFPRIAEDAAEALGITADEPWMDCPELGRRLPNPYHFLRYEFPRRRDWSGLWFTSVTHGDLNLNNILVDEKANLYVIDFSETRPRNALADFARIEPLITLQMTRNESDEDTVRLLRYLEGLASVSPLFGDPPLRYDGDDPIVIKSWAVVKRLRGYARHVTGGEDQPLFYWLPLLEWTLPIVSFRQLSTRQKRLSACAAGLLCEQLCATG